MPLNMPVDLQKIVPFTPGMNPAEVAERFGIPANEVVKLGSGENPFGPSPSAVNAIAEAVHTLHQYPEWTSHDLRNVIAKQEAVEPDHVVCGAGETEIISGIIRAFAGVGDEILMHRTTFPVYHQYAETEGREPIFADDGSAPEMSIDDLLTRITGRTRVIFVTTPHNPSGRVVSLADIRRLCRAAPQALVVVDEAYIHFSSQETAVGLLAEFDNAVVLRTFSKAYGLASLRVGFGIASSEVTSALLRVRPTWNLGNLQVAGAIAALADEAHVRRTTESIKAGRERLQHELDTIDGLSVVPGSQANFVLARVDHPRFTSTDLHRALAQRGVVIKDCAVSYLGLGDQHIRIDVSSDDVLDRLLTAAQEVLR